MEYTKFDDRRTPYREALSEIERMGFTFDDYLHHGPAFTGHMNLARFLALYETYRQTLGLAGHIAEAGVWKGACLLYFAKLAKIFEPESPTLVHGFDWYKGIDRGDEETAHIRDLVQASPSSRETAQPVSDEAAERTYATVKRLIALQGLERTVHLHKLDVTRQLGAFFEAHPHIQFKIVFLDIPTYAATRACIEHLWPRLVPGGVLILDTFNHEIAPGETRAVRECLPDDVPIRTYGFTNHPAAYVVKPACDHVTETAPRVPSA